MTSIERTTYPRFGRLPVAVVDHLRRGLEVGMNCLLRGPDG